MAYQAVFEAYTVLQKERETVRGRKKKKKKKNNNNHRLRLVIISW